MTETVFFVDDDPNILSGFQRMLRSRFRVETANVPACALEKIAHHPDLAVVVSDYRMPGMNGVEFLSQVAQLRPDSVRILLTGEADTKAAGAAVNQGQIFRFLLKPCPAMILEKNLVSAIEHFRLKKGEKELLERTLRGSMEMLMDLLTLASPQAFSQSLSIYSTIKTLVRTLQLTNPWEFEIAGLLSMIGCISVPVPILEKKRLGLELREAEQALYASNCALASRFLKRIPRLEFVSAVIAAQNGSLPPLPSWQAVDQMDRLALGAHLLDLAIRWEAFRHRHLPVALLIQDLQSLAYPTALLRAAEQLPSSEPVEEPCRVAGISVVAGMKIAEDVLTENGLLLIAKGQVLSETVAECLRRRYEEFGCQELFLVEVR